MNIKIEDNNHYVVKINSWYEKKYKLTLKEILERIKKKYNISIYGFYDVDIYEIPNLVKVIKYYKKDEDDYFNKVIDFNINNHIKEDNIDFDDFMLVNENNILKICEHYNILNLQ